MKKNELEAIIAQLLNEKSEISVAEVAESADLSKSSENDRKAIRRILSSLVKRGILAKRGAARASFYIRTNLDLGRHVEKTDAEKQFDGLQLAPESKVLLEYVSQTLTARIPVAYDQNLLRSYVPNQTYYLNAEQRDELLETGTVVSKLQPAGTYARTILNRLLIDLSWNSSRLEGNTYSLLETSRLIELGESVTGKDASEAQMILNHKEAIEYILESGLGGRITSHDICSVHALLSENLLGDTGASGRIRQVAVGIGGSTYLPIENPHFLMECFQLFVEKLNQIEDPFEQSLFALIHLSYLQAFEDINKRTSRIVANIPLIKKNLNPLSFTDVNQEVYVKALLGVYERGEICLIRDLFIWAYKRSSQRYSAIQQAMGEPNFLKLKYRIEIQEIVRSIILEKLFGSQIVPRIQNDIRSKNLPPTESNELFQLIEREILNLHEGNIARFKVRPSEYQDWKNHNKF